VKGENRRKARGMKKGREMNKEMEVREKEKGMKGWERREVRKGGGVAYRHFFPLRALVSDTLEP